MMGGRMEVESVPGQGTTFRFYVVLEKHPAGVPEQMIIPQDIRNCRILVVDDSA